MFAETPDQELLESSTSRFLDSHYPVSRIRQLADEDTTFDAALWRERARRWAGRRCWSPRRQEAVRSAATASPTCWSWLECSVTTPLPARCSAPMSWPPRWARWGSPEQREGPLADLLSGEAVAAWGHTSTAVSPAASRSVVLATGLDAGVVLSGRVPIVEGASDAAHLLVSASGTDGRSQYLVPLTAPGVELTRLNSVDLTRRYDDVVLRDVLVPADAIVGAPGTADDHDDELLDLAATMLLAEMVGAMDRAFAITLEWTVDRYSFGRPLGSYQAIKHRMADIRTQLEASEAIAASAAGAARPR